VLSLLRLDTALTSSVPRLESNSHVLDEVQVLLLLSNSHPNFGLPLFGMLIVVALKSSALGWSSDPQVDHLA